MTAPFVIDIDTKLKNDFLKQVKNAKMDPQKVLTTLILAYTILNKQKKVTLKKFSDSEDIDFKEVSFTELPDDIKPYFDNNNIKSQNIEYVNL
jgi:hypothetical protein